MNKANELPFQNDVIQQMQANAWLLGKPEGYNRALALYNNSPNFMRRLTCLFGSLCD